MKLEFSLMLLWLSVGVLVGCGATEPAVVAGNTPVAIATNVSAPPPTLPDKAPAASTPEPTPTASPTPAPKLTPLTTGGCCVSPSWSSDSRQVLFIDKVAPNAESGMYAVDVTAQSIEPQLVGPVGIYSPDRSLVAYPQDTRTIVEKLSTGERWVVPNNGQAVEFAPDDQHLAWENDAISGPYDQRQTEIYVANVDGKNASRVARVWGGGLVSWMPRGLSLMFLGRPSLQTHDRTLTVLDLRTNVAADLVTAERLSGMTLSNEGTWVAYYISFDQDEKRNGIWVQRTDGSSARQLDLWGAYQWRDDSHLLVIPARSSPDQPFEIWEVNAETGEKIKLTDAAVTPLNILNGDWRVSPDGKSVVFVNSADRNLWLLRLP